MDHEDSISRDESSVTPVISDVSSSKSPEHQKPPSIDDTVTTTSSNKIPPSPREDKEIEIALASLSLTTDSAETMFKSLTTIFQTSYMHEGLVTFHQADGTDVWSILQQSSDSESRGDRDVATLRIVRGILDQMLWSGSQLLLPAVKLLADASRDPSWRLPLGEGGILAFALATVAPNNVPDALQIQSLRLIGNACADTDENRNRVVSNHYLQMIIAKMESPTLSAVAVPVVYNICCDYEPAQQQAMACGIYPTLIRVLDSNLLQSSPVITYACRLLDNGIKEVDPSKSPMNAVEVLLQTASQDDMDVDDCASLADAAIAHLQSVDFQKHLVEEDRFLIPLRFLLRSYFPDADLSSSARLPPVTSMVPMVRDQEEETELLRVRKALISALSDVSALDEFAAKHSTLTTSLIDSLIKWLSATLTQLQLCACIILGNLAQSDQVCRTMVSRLQLHKDLIRIMKSTSDSQVVHSVLGFLRNLALPKENKQSIGEAGGIEALARYLSSDSLPQVSHTAAALARQLVIGNVKNIQRLLAPLSSDEDSPAHSRTYLTLLLGLFEKTDEVAVKTEVARVVASILRCLQSTEALQDPQKENLLHKFYSLHSNVGVPLGMMVSQSKYPVIRSEGWFAMALMARSEEGSAVINGIISDVSIYTALEDTIRGHPGIGGSTTTTIASGEPTPSDQAQTSREMQTKDRENAMILVNGLLQNQNADLMANIRRSALEELLHAGSQVDRH